MLFVVFACLKSLKGRCVLDNIFIKFVTKLCRRNTGFRLGNNCVALIADFLICYQRDFMASISYKKEAAIIQALNTTCRYLDDISKD